MSDHLTRKELKQDLIKEKIEHGAEAVYSHSKATGLLVLVVLLAIVGYASWKFYSDRQNLQASAAFDDAMKSYTGRIGNAGEAPDASELSFPNEQARSQDALQKFTAVAEKYPRTNSGRQATYYSALCMEDLERHNQALEALKKLSDGSDKELAAMANYQIANIYARTGKLDDAVKTYRALIAANSVFVPKGLLLIELGDLLSQSNASEAKSLYEQAKKDFPGTPVSDRADRGLQMIASKS